MVDGYGCGGLPWPMVHSCCQLIMVMASENIWGKKLRNKGSKPLSWVLIVGHSLVAMVFTGEVHGRARKLGDQHQGALMLMVEKRKNRHGQNIKFHFLDFLVEPVAANDAKDHIKKGKGEKN